MSTVKQTFLGDKTNLEQAYKDLARDVVRLETQLQKLATTSSTTSKAANKENDLTARILRSQISALGGVATGWLSVHTMLDMVNAQLERTIRLEEGAARAHRDLARGQAEIVLNTFGQEPAMRQRLMTEAARIAAETGTPETDIARGLGRLAGRGVGFTPDDLVSAQELATRVARHTPEQIEPLATAILQTMRVSGLSAEQSASLVQSGASAAFIGEPWQQARFLQQSISGMLASVPKPTAQSVEQSMELAAFISQAVGEERGEAGRTSAVALAAQLQEFREGRGPWAFEVPGGMGMKVYRPVKDMPTDPGDAMRWLQQNPAQARRFLDKATFERLFEGVWRDLIVSPGGVRDQLYKETQEAVKIDVPAFREQLSAIERATPQLEATTKAAQSQARTEIFSARQTVDALRKEAREIWLGAEGKPSALDLTSQYDWRPAWITRTGQWAAQRFDPFQDVEELASGELRMRAAQVRGSVNLDPWGRPTRDPRGSTRTIPTPDTMLSAEQRRHLDLVNEQLKRLEEIRDEIREQRQSQRQPSPAGPAQMERGAQRER